MSLRALRFALHKLRPDEVYPENREDKLRNLLAVTFPHSTLKIRNFLLSFLRVMSL